MKKYLKYKNFIPLDFIEKKKNKENKGNKRGFQVLILVNLILISINLQFIFNKKEEEVIITSEKEDSYLNKEEIYKWLNLYDNKMVELNVENNDGSIIYNIDEDIDYLEKKGIKFKIKDILLLDTFFNPIQKYYIKYMVFTPKEKILNRLLKL